MICSRSLDFSLLLDEKNYVGSFWIEDWRLENMDDMEKVCLHFVSCGHHLRVSYVAIEAFYKLLCEHVRRITKEDEAINELADDFEIVKKEKTSDA